MSNNGTWLNGPWRLEETRPTVPFFGSGWEVFGWDRQMTELESAESRMEAKGRGRGGRKE